MLERMWLEKGRTKSMRREVKGCLQVSVIMDSASHPLAAQL